MKRAGELARCRAFHGLSDEECRIWFGVGIALLERIEGGEVEPDEELEQRINRFLNMVGGRTNPVGPSSTIGGGGTPFSSAHCRSSPTHGGEPTGGAGGPCSAHSLNEPAREPPARVANFRSSESWR